MPKKAVRANLPAFSLDEQLCVLGERQITHAKDADLSLAEQVGGWEHSLCLAVFGKPLDAADVDPVGESGGPLSLSGTVIGSGGAREVRSGTFVSYGPGCWGPQSSLLMSYGIGSHKVIVFSPHLDLSINPVGNELDSGGSLFVDLYGYGLLATSDKLDGKREGFRARKQAAKRKCRRKVRGARMFNQGARKRRQIRNVVREAARFLESEYEDVVDPTGFTFGSELGFEDSGGVAEQSWDATSLFVNGLPSEGNLIVDLSMYGPILNAGFDESLMGDENVDGFRSEVGDIFETGSVDSEAEAIWNISQALGIRFVGCKQVVTEAFKNLEMEDRKVFGR
ncbi:hypothetical protein REPUB_Repub13aG0165800 [Reevesia pubescens]